MEALKDAYKCICGIHTYEIETMYLHIVVRHEIKSEDGIRKWFDNEVKLVNYY